MPLEQAKRPMNIRKPIPPTLNGPVNTDAEWLRPQMVHWSVICQPTSWRWVVFIFPQFLIHDIHIWLIRRHLNGWIEPVAGSWVKTRCYSDQQMLRDLESWKENEKQYKKDWSMRYFSCQPLYQLNWTIYQILLYKCKYKSFFLNEEKDST